jgi:recombination protein RecA
MGQIEKQFGKGSIMRLGENTNLVVETMPSGSLALILR